MKKFAFLKSFFRSPAEVGTIFPSTRFTVNALVRQVQKENPKVVVELGAGTGAFTKGLDKIERDDKILIIFEKDREVREQLIKEYPHLPIYEDAFDLPSVLEELGLESVDCIVCGLPFALLPEEKVDQLVQSIYSVLDQQGLFTMYQYSTQMKKRLQKIYNHVDIKVSYLNIPPTFLYFCRK